MKSWPTNADKHLHMRMRQIQNRANCKDSLAESWMADLLTTTDYRWTRQAQWGFRLYDFWCPYIGIAVEVDGPEHDKEKDKQDDLDDFERSAIIVLRVRNFNERDAQFVLGTIDHSCTWNERRLRIPLPEITSNFENFKLKKVKNMNSPFKRPPGDSTLEQAEPTDPGTGTPTSDKAEIIESASQKAALVKADRAAEQQKRELAKFDNISSLDWKQIPPPMLAQILVSIPFKGSGQDPDYYLTPVQGMIFALRCFELGLSPFSNEVWFNSKNNKVNVTFEGKLKLARMNGLNLSPPLFERIPANPAQALVAYKCTIMAPHGKCEYTATLKEWMVSSSPVWKSKPDHMLQLRAAEKCLSFATGSGSSELMGEQDLQVGKEAESFIPSFTQEKV